MSISNTSIANFTLSLCVFGCTAAYGRDNSLAGQVSNAAAVEISIVPKPMRVKNYSNFFTFSPAIRICLDPPHSEIMRIAEYLSALLSRSVGKKIEIGRFCTERAERDFIILRVDSAKKSLGQEGYELTINPDGVKLCAFSPAGLFYGCQTFRQLLPPPVAESDSESGLRWRLPCVEIEDKPRYQWRGMLLDCARHFMSKQFIKRYIDLLACHKLNVLHLHLTDDQGWRIEVKKYPKLMKIGAYRGNEENHYGGYYTQDDLKEIVAYAKSRYVNVIPEVEMPGHASAAIASYPYLSCHGNRIPVATEWGVFADVFCPGKESTFEFLEGVLGEVIEVFPSRYIHIGGDEAPRKHWEQCSFCQKRIRDENLKNEDELQSYLIHRVERFLSRNGRRVIGWDEILSGGGLPPSAVVQSWRGMDGAIAGSKLGHDVISSPNQFVYFDYPQGKTHNKPAWMSVTPLQKVYSFSPTPPGLTSEQSKHILGAECTMWTEHAPQEEVDRQLFPRLCAFSEVVWSPADGRSWNDFETRMEQHYERLRSLGVDYYRE